MNHNSIPQQRLPFGKMWCLFEMSKLKVIIRIDASS